jgi:hypothetical protein
VIWESAGVLKLDPRPFQFYQLMAMRHGCEFEAWDRLAFSTAYAASFVGVKKVKMEHYHKFLAETNKSSTVDEIKALKGYFKES